MSLSCGILAAVEARYAFLRLHDIKGMDPVLALKRGILQEH
jgi:hypothetical protein